MEGMFNRLNGYTNPIVYWHNLKFDGSYIINYLHRQGYKERHIEYKEGEELKNQNIKLRDKEYYAYINHHGQYYRIGVCTQGYDKNRGIKQKTILFDNSINLLPFSVDAIAKNFRLIDKGVKKLSIDYDYAEDGSIRQEGHTASQNESDYIRADVKIPAMGLNALFNEIGVSDNPLTIGQLAYRKYKDIFKREFGGERFQYVFPSGLPQDELIRKAYKGGYTYCNHELQNKVIDDYGLVLDVNSLYPSVMYYEQLPYGKPFVYEGDYNFLQDEIRESYPLYIQCIQCSFKLKEGKMPTIQLKGNFNYQDTEYIRESTEREVLWLTNVDLKLFFDHYEVYALEYLQGYAFQSSDKYFKPYIDEFMGMKISGETEKNYARRGVAKLFLNSLYGKFATNPRRRSKYPFMDEGTLKFVMSPTGIKPSNYTAVACFTTSYARNKTIRSGQAIEDNYRAGKSSMRFLYADTDSLHIQIPDKSEIPMLYDMLDIDKQRLGAWKIEGEFDQAKYIRAKCYMEHLTEFGENEYFWKMTVAGMPSRCAYDMSVDPPRCLVDFKDFKMGLTLSGKLVPKQVVGGVILKEIDFTLKFKV